MKVIFQPRKPFVTDEGVFSTMAGDCHVDDDAIYFTLFDGLVRMAIKRADVIFGGILPFDFDLASLSNKSHIFVVDPWPQSE